MYDRSGFIEGARTVIVKVGSSTLTYPSGLLNIDRIDRLVRQLADLRNRGLKVILVTSGAIGAGMGKLGLSERPKTIPEKQAAAAVGQGILMHMYEKLFSEYGQTVGQILLTREDMRDRKRFLNARNALFALLNNNVIPIINENDAVVVDEIKFGDNDTLSALVGSLVDADILILLSDIDGLYNDNPKLNSKAELISTVEEITKEIEEMAKGAGSTLGTGGMYTKIKAAKISVSLGMAMVICNGEKDKIITEIFSGANVGTWFKAEDTPLGARKRWIAYSTGVTGEIILDEGAINALNNEHKSLLPKGILNVNGVFQEGQVVSIMNEKEIEIGRGIVNYNSKDLNKIKGFKTCEIEKVLGFKDYDEVIHRDNMVVFNEFKEGSSYGENKL